MTGQTIAHYKILEQLGAGGMGIVYKALDTHLDRFVAIKVLPPEKVTDAERKRRFVQEAKAASALNHPNIITIHDIASENGIDFIVMEFVPGKALNQLIGRKGLPLGEALKYAVQIADALAAAHAAGIIHRDLKPGNVMVGGAEGRPGLVKVLDFGLAKLTDKTESSEREFTETIRQDDAPGTDNGTIVGTVSYMSPEQAEGKKVDARSDIFSFGTLLYEIVTGQRAFQRESKLATLSAILREEPKPASHLVEELPRELERIIARCLRKSPERRFQAMPDLKVALEELKEESDSGVRTPVVPGKKRSAVTWWSIGAAVVAVVLLIGGTAWWRMSKTAPEPDKEVTVVPLTARPGDERDPTFSPDGSQVAYAWGPEGGTPDIYVKLIGPGEPIRLTNTPEDERMPQWSPDGRWIAFPRGLGTAGIVVVPALGGSERMIARENASNYVSWSADSQWVAYCSGTPESLYLAPLNGGEKKLVLGPLQGKFPVVGGILSPDSRKLALLYGVGQSQRPLTLCACQSVALMISARVAPLGRLISASIFAPLLSARGVLASLRAGLLTVLPVLAFFLAASIVLPPLAAFWPVGAPFFWLAPFFEGAFSGATCAPCSATVAAVSVVVASAFFIVVFVLSAVDPRMTIHHFSPPERQANSDLLRNDSLRGEHVAILHFPSTFAIAA